MREDTGLADIDRLASQYTGTPYRGATADQRLDRRGRLARLRRAESDLWS